MTKKLEKRIKKWCKELKKDTNNQIDYPPLTEHEEAYWIFQEILKEHKK